MLTSVKAVVVVLAIVLYVAMLGAAEWRKRVRQEAKERERVSQARMRSELANRRAWERREFRAGRLQGPGF